MQEWEETFRRCGGAVRCDSPCKELKLYPNEEVLHQRVKDGTKTAQRASIKGNSPGVRKLEGELFQRTFWEKLGAVHKSARREKLPGPAPPPVEAPPDWESRRLGTSLGEGGGGGGGGEGGGGGGREKTGRTPLSDHRKGESKRRNMTKTSAYSGGEKGSKITATNRR